MLPTLAITLSLLTWTVPNDDHAATLLGAPTCRGTFYLKAAWGMLL